MFGFDEEEAIELGSAGRFQARIEKFRIAGKRFPLLQHYAWWVIHNAGAHVFLAAVPCKWSFDFHDWTSRKLNAA